MRDMREAELGLAIAEGLVSENEAAALRVEAHRLNRSPLELLRERSVLSDESLASLRRRAHRAEAARDPEPQAVSTLTATPAQQPTTPPEAPAFPVQGWSRYRSVRFLGQGGMGRVFLAYDPQLRRNVALKFMREDAPALTRRFLAEARAQARVRHERVCHVYEVGEIEGRVYIAMQYVEGPSLLALARELTVEQKVLVLREAAEGVHEAHRAGLIHRDIKPSNILVERTDNGRLKPYVMDFGLARDWREGATATGALLGTPQYMSPEQARGEVGRLDRRADVYSLGATLYHLLTGQYPIPGGNGLEVLNNIATVEPRPLRAVDPDLPSDLEAIVLKCLEKDRSARYDSARALIEELDRFLAGEPVRASSGPWYRLRKRLRKHRLAVSLSAAALTVVALALSWAGLARRETALRERLARRFTEQVERIEAMARYSDLSRLHDTTADHAILRARMDALAAEIREDGELAVGPGHYALGRGFLALGEEEKAREYLESAWGHGYREPRSAYALALVTGRVYQRQLQEAERLRDAGQREARKRDIERRYRDPALAYLRQSEGAEVPSTGYVEALVAFYEGRFDDALARLDALGDGLPWFYEAPELRGDILVARAGRAVNEGQREKALADFASGREAYARAAAVAESVPAIHEALGELEYGALYVELYSTGNILPHVERGLQAVARALVAAPDHYESLVLRARFQRRLAEYRTRQAGDVEGPLRQALADAQRALRLAPARREARLELGRSLWQWGQYLQLHNRDPKEPLEQAAGIYQGFAPEERDAEVSLQLGLVHQAWAKYESNTGADPLAHQDAAIQALLEATALDPRMTAAWINLGIMYLDRASHPRTPDVEADLNRAVAALETARRLDPQHIAAYFYGAQVHTRLASRKMARGQDNQHELEQALGLARQGIAVNRGVAQLYHVLGQVLLSQAEVEWETGGNPFPLIAQARQTFARAIALDPKPGGPFNNVGQAYIFQAGYEQLLGKDPGQSVRAAIDAFQQALKLIAEQAAPRFNLGKAYFVQASFEWEHGRDPGEPLRRALETISEGLRINPRDAYGLRYLGETLGLRARWRRNEEDFKKAAQALREALEAAPRDQDLQLAFAQLDCSWASAREEGGGDPGDPLKHGSDLVAKLRAARPGWARARLLEAHLLALQADGATPPENQRRLTQQAVEAAAAALAANRNLEARWRSLVLHLRSLRSAPRQVRASASGAGVAGGTSPPLRAPGR